VVSPLIAEVKVSLTYPASPPSRTTLKGMLGAWPARRKQRTEVDIGAGGQGNRGIITAGARACAVVTVVLAGFAAIPAAAARPSDPGVVNHVVLDKGSVGNIVGATMGWEDVSTVPVQDYWVDLPVCNNYADVGLPEVYNDPGLASFNGAVMQESPIDETHYVKQAAGVFATNDAANGGVSPDPGPYRWVLGADHRDAH
jgi:hypothetical protein